MSLLSTHLKLRLLINRAAAKGGKEDLSSLINQAAAKGGKEDLSSLISLGI